MMASFLKDDTNMNIHLNMGSRSFSLILLSAIVVLIGYYVISKVEIPAKYQIQYNVVVPIIILLIFSTAHRLCCSDLPNICEIPSDF